MTCYPGKSFALKSIPKQSDLFRTVPEPIRTHPSKSERNF